MSDLHKDALTTLVEFKLKEKNLDNELHQKRLKGEMLDVEIQGEYAYFMDLYNRKIKYPENENNLLIVYLLDIAPDFDINKEKAFTLGEMPDLDTDFISEIRDYLKTDWAKREFGEEYVCAIGNYNRFGIKNSLLDMARIFDLPHDEIQRVTKELPLKDEEGDTLTWESALKYYPDLKAWCEKYPDAAEAAAKISSRVKGLGKHAGGVIISKVPLNDIVPLLRSKSGEIMSSWAEGQNTQDLQPIGLIKSDWLVIANLIQIELACKFIKERHNVESICAFPGDKDWSDDSYLDDENMLKTANAGDLKCIFQFDNNGLQALVKDGGVTEFNDLPIYSSLWRPGCMQSKMHTAYVRRKKGLEKYLKHPILEPILGKTYGVLIFQEQINKLLNIIGKIPLKDCEIIRKAISKKKIEYFSPYKEQFITNAQIVLGYSKEQVEEIWNNIEAFAEYGFNRSVDICTLIPTIENNEVKLKKIKDFKPGDKVFKIDENGKKTEETVVALHDHGVLDGYEVTFDDGYKIVCSINHKFLTEKGQISLKEIIGNNYNILCDTDTYIEYKENYAKKEKTGLACSMRSNMQKSSKTISASKRLRRLSRVKAQNRQLEVSLQSSVSKQILNESTSSIVQRMSQVFVENKRSQFGNSVNRTQISLWTGSRNISLTSATPSRMRHLHKNKTSKYQIKKFKNKPIGISSTESFYNCSKNFGSSRNTIATIRTIKKLARGKSRKISKLCKINDKSSFQLFQNGNLDEKNIKLGISNNQLRWKRKKCRFCFEQYLDRNRWISSFLCFKKHKEKIFSQKSTNKRRYAQTRSITKKEYNAAAIQHGMFCNINRGDEIRMDRMDAEHATITDTGGLVSRKIVRILPVGKRQMRDLEVASPTHNFVLPNGIVTSNSHACGYAMVSARLLWLKTYYPIEFYNAILVYEEEADKIKEYKIEIKNHKIKLNSLDINKSKDDFSIQNEELYFGFNKVKGIGYETAKQIMDLQPYLGFEDFIKRFGTGITILKPLICLRVFNDATPIKLYKYLDYYRNFEDKIKKGEKSYLEKLEKLKVAIDKLLPDEADELKVFSEENLALWKEKFSKTTVETSKVVLDPNTNEDVLVYATKNLFKLLNSLYNRFVNANEMYADIKREVMPLADFDENSHDAEISPEFEICLTNIVEAEKKYYGFVWYSNLEKSPDCDPSLNFAQFTDGINQIFPVEFEIMSLTERKGKKVTYYQVVAEDINGSVQKINFWKDDYDRFEDELKTGNLIRARLKPPSNGFNTFSFESYPKYDFKNKVPDKKEDDFRLVVLKKEGEK